MVVSNYANLSNSFHFISMKLSCFQLENYAYVRISIVYAPKGATVSFFFLHLSYHTK